MDIDRYSLTCDWMEGLLQEYEEEAKMEAEWPTLLLQPSERRLVWGYCDVLGVTAKGVPGSACRLLERYLSRNIRTYLQESRDNNITLDLEEWERFKDVLASQFHISTVSCIQLAAKMADLMAPLSATLITATLGRVGLAYTKAEVVHMEYHVYKTLDFRIPLWTTLEISEFLATQVGLKEPVLEAVGLINNLTEYHRNRLEIHIKCWSDYVSNTPGSSSSSASKVTLHKLHVCAGVVAAAARYMSSPVAETPERLASLTRTSYSFIKALADGILKVVIPEPKHIGILKKRRLR